MIIKKTKINFDGDEPIFFLNGFGCDMKISDLDIFEKMSVLQFFNSVDEVEWILKKWIIKFSKKIEISFPPSMLQKEISFEEIEIFLENLFSKINKKGLEIEMPECVKKIVGTAKYVSFENFENKTVVKTEKENVTFTIENDKIISIEKNKH